MDKPIEMVLAVLRAKYLNFITVTGRIPVTLIISSNLHRQLDSIYTWDILPIYLETDTDDSVCVLEKFYGLHITIDDDIETFRLA